MRDFSSQEIGDWLKEDQIDEETRATGEKLLADLQTNP